MAITAEKATTGITSVKLGHRKDTLAQLAERQNRSVHSLVLEAVDLFTEQQKAWQDFEDQALRSYERYQATGLHVTLEEMEVWAKKLKNNPNESLPKCHI
jgi:predicted transcriptional regulator